MSEWDDIDYTDDALVEDLLYDEYELCCPHNVSVLRYCKQCMLEARQDFGTGRPVDAEP